jgi:hypothetical protein
MTNTKHNAVNVHHIRDAKPTEMLSSDRYVFSSPPTAGMRRFLTKVRLPAGANYAILTTGSTGRRAAARQAAARVG